MAFSILLDGEEIQIDILRRRPHLVVRIDGREHVVHSNGHQEDGLDMLVIAGHQMHIARAQSHDGLALRTASRTYRATLAADGEDAEGQGRNSEIRAPMPGAVISISAKAGDEIKAGDTVITIESMKLETVLTAPRNGILAEVLVSGGDGFEKDQLLARLVDEEVEPLDA